MFNRGFHITKYRIIIGFIIFLTEELLGYKLLLTIYGETALVNCEIGAVFKGIAKSGDDVVDIHIFCNQ